MGISYLNESLLENVLHLKVNNYSVLPNFNMANLAPGVFIYINTTKDEDKQINYQEFVFVCKEWLLSNSVQFDMAYSQDKVILNIVDTESMFIGRSEAEVIFKTCAHVINTKY